MHVKDGAARLRVAVPETHNPSVSRASKWVVNVPAQGEEGKVQEVEKMVRPRGYTVHGLRSIVGPHAVPLPDQQGSIVKVTEGMWEDKRGRKIDGGERRRAEIRFKKRSAERRAEREAEALANM